MNEMNEQTKVPFYMISPMQKLYQMEMEYEKDMERMKVLYPRQVQQLLPLVEDYCDGLEYEGSRIYDENPDAAMMRRECEKLIRNINDKIQDENISNGGQIQAAERKSPKASFSFVPPEGWELPPFSLQKSGPKSLRPCASKPGMNPSQSGMNPPQSDMNSRQPGGNPPPDWQDALIGVLFHNEIFRRRSRHRRCCRWW